MASDIRKGLESDRAYDMSSLLKKYAALLEKRGIDGQKYTKKKLKLRMKSHFGETIVFHQPYQKTRPELVYSSSISLQNVINDFDSSCRNDSDERKVLCLAQDAIHCSSHGRVKLPKHVGLAMCVRHLTGSKQLLF